MIEISSPLKKKYFNFLKKQEITGEPFYNKLEQLKKFYIPICHRIFKKFSKKKQTIIIGLSGGQGSGKTTIAKILSIILNTKYGLKVTTFSIDDFYKTIKSRQKMSNKYSKLFLTRGVPGTHDTRLLLKCINGLKNKKFTRIMIPKFDKSIDNRLPQKKWTIIKKKPNIIIFEGWCVGCESETQKNLKNPLNNLEKKEDKDLSWRVKVNDEIKKNYFKIFKKIDEQIFLKVPSFSYVIKWRLLQEKKLAINSSGNKIMNKNEIKRFVMFYERITKNMIKNFNNFSTVISLDKKHRLKSIRFN
tara:strand:+ start:401 stop:1306 length:906 start_codon:yes stop_codon:yes gene_type:complete